MDFVDGAKVKEHEKQTIDYMALKAQWEKIFPIVPCFLILLKREIISWNLDKYL